jgi:radical SAM superfamily enzyme YgiQ (UPF0313 family)
MNTILLCALNARYSHSCLALLYLKHAAPGLPVSTAEYNINDSTAQIVADIVVTSPDAVGFSCYIWNISHVLKIASAVKKLLPGCLILLGGPEVSFDAPALMQDHRFIDIIVRGAGEAPFAHFSSAFCRGQSITDTPSACIRDGETLIETANAEPTPLAVLPFVYDDLSPFAHKILYYETSRGCPFRCAYCLSAETPLDFLPTGRVIRELEFFIRHSVRQVKLVDRTFNHPDSRAREVFSALIALAAKYPQSRTNFHFEISASLLSPQTLAVLTAAPPGLLQFEVGIQSTHADTLAAVGRSHDTKKLLDNASALCRMDNLRVHVDLIAGLPCETEQTFSRSFDDAYRLGAHRLQLGFLKLLKGSPLRAQADRFGIIFTDDAPYEVLQTASMSYATLRCLHRIEALVDTLYNSRAAHRTLALLTAHLSPYALFSQLTAHFEKDGFFTRPHKLTEMFEHLYVFASGLHDIDASLLRESLAFDWLCRQRSDAPACCAMLPSGDDKAFARRFFTDANAVSRYLPDLGLSARQLERRCRIVFFPLLFGKPSYALFDYGKKPDDPGFWQLIS